MHIAFATTFPSKEFPSPCLNLTCLVLFQIPNLRASHLPATEEITPVSTTTSTASPAKYSLTDKRGACRGVRTIVDDVLGIRFPNPLLNLAP